MGRPPRPPFDPCSCDSNEQIPAKIWELLRRNVDFREAARLLAELDAQERQERARGGPYHGPAWEKSYHLVHEVEKRHPIAAIALQWLVPEPLFRVQRVAFPLGKVLKERRAVPHRVLQVGEGLSPNLDGESWQWWDNDSQANHAGHRETRGPDVDWTDSKIKRLADKVNPLLECLRYRWPFTVYHTWNEAPPPLRRSLHFIWCHFDSRAINPISNRRSDAAVPHETDFFRHWRLDEFRASGTGNLSKMDMLKVFKFNELANNYRVFAIPAALLTRQAAKSAFDSLYKQVGESLSDERQFFGTKAQWRDFLAVEAHQSATGATRKHAIQFHVLQNYGSRQMPARQKYQNYETDVTCRVSYIDGLRTLLFPSFSILDLLRPMQHRRSTRPRKTAK